MLNLKNNLKKTLSLAVAFLFLVSNISYADALRTPMNGTARVSQVIETTTWPGEAGLPEIPPVIRENVASMAREIFNRMGNGTAVTISSRTTKFKGRRFPRGGEVIENDQLYQAALQRGLVFEMLTQKYGLNWRLYITEYNGRTISEIETGILMAAYRGGSPYLTKPDQKLASNQAIILLNKDPKFIADEIAQRETEAESNKQGHEVINKYVGIFLTALNSDDDRLRSKAVAFLKSDELKGPRISDSGRIRLTALLGYSDKVRQAMFPTGQVPVNVLAEVQQEAATKYGAKYTVAMMCPFDETITRAMARKAKELEFVPVFIMAPSQSTKDGKYIGKNPALYREMCERIMHEEAPGIPFSVKMDHGNTKAHDAQDIMPFVEGGCDSFLVDGSALNNLEPGKSPEGRYKGNIDFTVARIVEIVEKYKELHDGRLPGIQVEAEEVGNVFTQPDNLRYYLKTLKEELRKRGVAPGILKYVAVNIGTTHGDIFTGIDLGLMTQLQRVASEHEVYLVCHGTSRTPPYYLAFFPELAGGSHIATDFATTKLRAIKDNARDLFEMYAEALTGSKKGITEWAKTDFGKQGKQLKDVPPEARDKFVIKWGRYVLDKVIAKENAYFAEHPDRHEKVLVAVEGVVGMYAKLYRLPGTTVFCYSQEDAKKTKASAIKSFAENFEEPGVTPQEVSNKMVLEAYKQVADTRIRAEMTTGQGIDTARIRPSIKDIISAISASTQKPVDGDRIESALGDLEKLFSPAKFPVSTGLIGPTVPTLGRSDL